MAGSWTPNLGSICIPNNYIITVNPSYVKYTASLLQTANEWDAHLGVPFGGTRRQIFSNAMVMEPVLLAPGGRIIRPDSFFSPSA